MIVHLVDIFGNDVVLHDDTWRDHILARHPEMAGRIDAVSRAVKDPDVVRRSTIAETAAVFEAFDGTSKVCVVVNYDRGRYAEGRSAGIVATAYPVDTRKYSFRKVGKPFYEKAKK